MSARLTLLPVFTEEAVEDAIRDAAAYIRSAFKFGRPVILTSSIYNVSPREAAEYLGISRPTLIKILERGEIPFEWAGGQRIIAFGDIERYRRSRKQSPWNQTYRSFHEAQLTNFLEIARLYQ